MSDDESLAEEVAALRRTHGVRASQVVADRIVAAVRGGDRAALVHLAALMQAVEAEKLRRPPIAPPPLRA